MVQQTKWVERIFHFDFPIGVFPCLLERLRGTPARIEEIVHPMSGPTLTAKINGHWSIQEHVGHLLDLETLGERRLMDFRSGATTLTPADMTNRKTFEANHNANLVAIVLKEFRSARSVLVEELELFNEEEAGRVALHPRLNIPMRVVDWCYFMAEHDDHHVARIVGLARQMQNRV